MYSPMLSHLKTRLTTIVAIFLLCTGWSQHAWSAKKESGRPNILLIVADDLGYSDLGCFGGEIETPQLDSLAARGVRLTQYYNTGRCCPSRGSIMTGQYPHRIGLGHMTRNLNQRGYQGHIADEAITVAQILQQGGYRTFLSGKWHLGTEDPTKLGFEEFYGTLVSAKTFWDVDHFTRLPASRATHTYPKGEFYGTDAVTDYAIDFLRMGRRTPDHPWFLYLAYNAPHFPLHAPKEDILKYADRYHVGWDQIRKQRLARMKELKIVPPETKLSPRSRYWDWGESEARVNPAWDSLPTDRRGDLARRMAIFAAMVDRMDQNIGRVLTSLRQNNELENTLIIFTSDNGACAEWDPHGFDIRSSRNNTLYWGDQLDKMGGPDTHHSVGSGWANASNTPWRLYKHYNHEGGIASPGIIHWPRQIKQKGAIVSTPAHIIDIVPTLLEVSEVSYPQKWDGHSTLPLPGKSLIPQINGKQQTDRTLYFEHQGNRAIREGHWKLSALRGGDWELYDLSQDRTELNDLAEQRPDLVNQLDQKWNLWAKENFVLPFPKDYRIDYLPPIKE
ncbi:arylsulfatase [Gimesia fumaroli]|uniref:Arylsulfatase n=1 Tax=Gimesia fumaroli TaxID=2527976 RepID=A0A518IA47_9PLAN|nr:arylsulfatase [Gimesia fumaroli]QDV49920.1 Arylsulfatase [Gimesia fumaroli]